MADLPPRPNLRPCEIAEFLKVSDGTVYELLRAGEIPSIRVGRQYRIPREPFLDWYRSSIERTAGE